MTTCDFGCMEGGAADYCADCTPGTPVCVGTTSYKACGDDGHYADPVDCTPQVCSGGACVDCIPNSTQCADALNQQTCGADGTWGPLEPCANGCMGVACAPAPAPSP
jgi:hypothetical protein